jgi:hypothetical protein
MPAEIIVSTFPQRSPPRILAAAACGGLESTPDRRTRRTYLHLSYSCASPFGPALLVSQSLAAYRPYLGAPERPPRDGGPRLPDTHRHRQSSGARAELLGNHSHVILHVLPAERSGSAKDGGQLGVGSRNRLVDGHGRQTSNVRCCAVFKSPISMGKAPRKTVASSATPAKSHPPRAEPEPTRLSGRRLGAGICPRAPVLASQPQVFRLSRSRGVGRRSSGRRGGAGGASPPSIFFAFGGR